MTWQSLTDRLFDSDLNLKPYKNNMSNNLFLDLIACNINYASSARNGKHNRSIWQPLVELEMKGQTFYIVDRAVVKSLLIGLVRSSIGHRAFMAIYKGMPLKETLEYWMTLEDSSETLTGRFRELTTGDKVITSINTGDISTDDDYRYAVDLLENMGYTCKVYHFNTPTTDPMKIIATSEYSDEIEIDILNKPYYQDAYINGKYNVTQTDNDNAKDMWASNYFIQPTLAKMVDFSDTFKVERIIRDLHAGFEETRKWCPTVKVDGSHLNSFRLPYDILGCVKHSYHLSGLARNDRNRLMHEMFLDVRRTFRKN